MTRRYRPHGEGSASGAEEHALALESAWSRNAYGARHTEDLYEVMRSVENRLGTITSLRWTEHGAWVSLRTSRTHCNPGGTVRTHPACQDRSLRPQRFTEGAMTVADDRYLPY